MIRSSFDPDASGLFSKVRDPRLPVDRRDDFIGEVVDAVGPGGEGVVHF